MKPMLKIKVGEKHTGEIVRAIINSKKPMVLMLESSSPCYNPRTFHFANELMKSGWEEKNTKYITKRNPHKRKLLKITLINSSIING